MIKDERYVELSNRVRIPYYEKGSKTAIPLILLHGLADSWHVFERIFPYLPDFIHTIAPTQRGHGDASHPETGYGTEDFESDLVAFMDTLHIGKAVILGASSGGFVAKRFAANHPERTLGLILLGAPSTFRDNPVIQETWNSTISKLKDPVDPDFVRRFASSTLPKTVPQDFLEMMIRENQKVLARVWIKTCEALFEEEFPGELGKIKAPVLLLWGDKDTVLVWHDQEIQVEAMENSMLIIHHGAGHMLYCEEPDRVAFNIIAFVQGLRST